VAFLVALRGFARETLLPIFREDLNMFKEMEIIKELVIESGALAEWGEQTGYNARLREQAKAEGIAEGKAEGIAEGKAEGEAEGEAKAVRSMTLRFLTNRFGVLPEELVQRIETGDADWCQSLFDRAVHASSLGELLQE
jgi:flagellar biosynthesis/type III secretory pathway protein FliH